MIPAPAGGIVCPCADVESHPAATILHVRLECRTLRCGRRQIVQEKHDLVIRKETGVQVVPVGSSFIREAVLGGNLRELLVGFLYEGNMRLIESAVVEGDHLETGRLRLNVEYCRQQQEYE